MVLEDVLSKRVRALLEVCLMTFFFVVFVGWLFEAFLRWLVFWYWFLKVCWVFVALLAVIIPKRSLRAYGFLPRDLRSTLKWGAVIVAVFILPAAASIVASVALGIAKPAGLSLLGIALNVVYYAVFVGFVEEAYFRGYVQSRLNEVFEKRWRRFIFKTCRVDYGLGLFLASALFALIHVVNYWNPLTYRWEPTWWMPIHIFAAFAFGCLAGVLRESSGAVYIPASLHGGIMTAYAFLLTYTDELILNISLFISWFTFFYFLDRLMIASGSE